MLTYIKTAMKKESKQVNNIKAQANTNVKN
jgi:hypothetical protein